MNKNILQATIAIALLMCLAFALDSARKWSSGAKRIDSFNAMGVATDVFDIKAGNRACLVFVSKFENQPQPQFFFSCPQDR